MDSAEKKNILVVDDDREIVRAIALNLESEGYTVFKAYDGMEALDLAMTKDIHLIIIDVMMPRLDGLSAIMKIREKKNLPSSCSPPKARTATRSSAFPWARTTTSPSLQPMELVARVKSQLRRYTSLGDIHSSGENTIVNGRLTFNLDEHVLYADGEPVKLTATETKIVELLMRNPGRIFPAEEIYSKIWNESAYSTENTVMVHIRRIREKIEINPGEPEYLKVVWGIGYKFEKH